jgi:hypothetical protein
MKYCNACKVYVLGSSQCCPLCFSELSGTDAEDTCEGYPRMKEIPKKYNFLSRFFLFLSIATCLVCLLINLLDWSGMLWSLIVATGILLLWETVGFMILSKKNIGWRLFAQMLAILIVFITIDAVTGWRAWSIGYFAPFVIIASSCAMTIILYIKRTQWREYMLFQFIIAINGFIPVVLYWCGLTKALWPSAAGALYSLLSLLGMMIFFDKQFKNEMKKRFHV